jgi:hypothetical protein
MLASYVFMLIVMSGYAGWLSLLAILDVFVVNTGWLCWVCCLILLAMTAGYDA